MIISILIIQWTQFYFNSLRRCIRVFRDWFSEIVNSFDVPYTNSTTEGFNNKIKMLKRNAFGYRNF